MEIVDMSWHDVERSIDTLAEVEGGYTSAHRGIITLPSGEQVFVKIGADGNTKKWAHKEVKTYRFLMEQSYPYIPTLLATNEEETSFALSTLKSDDGWDWTNTWNDERLNKTLQAIDALAAIKPDKAHTAYFTDGMIDEGKEGWQQLASSFASQRTLLEKLRNARHEEIADRLKIEAMARQASQFTFTHDTLVHYDVRADNCAWNPHTQRVKLVDWNWTQLGDRRLDVSAFLVGVHKSGMDVMRNHRERLDRNALLWMAGYWLNAATMPMQPGSSEHSSLRDYQLASGITAFNLAETIQSH